MTDTLAVPAKDQGERRLMNFRLTPDDEKHLATIQRAEALRGLRLSLTQCVQMAIAEAAKKRR